MLLLLLLVCQLLLQRQSGVEMFHARTGRFELATTGAAISLTAALSVRLQPLLLYQCRGPNRNFDLLRRSDKKKKGYTTDLAVVVFSHSDTLNVLQIIAYKQVEC